MKSIKKISERKQAASICLDELSWLAQALTHWSWKTFSFAVYVWNTLWGKVHLCTILFLFIGLWKTATPLHHTGFWILNMQNTVSALCHLSPLKNDTEGEHDLAWFFFSSSSLFLVTNKKKVHMLPLLVYVSSRPFQNSIVFLQLSRLWQLCPFYFDFQDQKVQIYHFLSSLWPPNVFIFMYRFSYLFEAETLQFIVTHPYWQNGIICFIEEFVQHYPEYMLLHIFLSIYFNFYIWRVYLRKLLMILYR